DPDAAHFEQIAALHVARRAAGGAILIAKVAHLDRKIDAEAAFLDVGVVAAADFLAHLIEGLLLVQGVSQRFGSGLRSFLFVHGSVGGKFFEGILGLLVQALCFKCAAHGAEVFVLRFAFDLAREVFEILGAADAAATEATAEPRATAGKRRRE